jgi:hypothetical protein
MGYLGAGLLLVAVLAGTGQQIPTPLPTTVPESVSASPLLTENAAGEWSTTLYLGTATLCAGGAEASFSLITTGPETRVRTRGPAALDPTFNCRTLTAVAWKAFVASNPLTQVTLRFDGQGGMPVTPPASAAIVVSTPSSPPMQVTVSVHRWVNGIEYLGVPVACGLGLWLLFIAAMLLGGLRDPGGGTLRGRKILDRPLYAQSTWTFSGSWATSLTTAGAVTAVLLTATGVASEVLPGVEPGRFSLLIVAAGAITATAPLLFGALNYSSQRADPTTARVSVIRLPAKPPAGPATGGVLVTLLPDHVHVPGASGPPTEIAVPAGAILALPCGGTVQPGTPEETAATLRPGAKLAVPPDAVIRVAALGDVTRKALAVVPGTNDIEVFDGQQVTISPSVIIAAKDVVRGTAMPPSWQKPGQPSFRLGPRYRLTGQGGARIFFIGQARLRLPAGAVISAPVEETPAGEVTLKIATPFVLPRTREVVASRMWPLLAASLLTLFGTGAELGILGVLACWLSSAGPGVRWASAAMIGAMAFVALYYSVVSVRALADPAPGDALNAAGGSFIL